MASNRAVRELTPDPAPIPRAPPFETPRVPILMIRFAFLLLAAALLVAGGWAAGRAGDAPSSPRQTGPLENASDLDLRITATARGTNAIWMNPGVRNLQPKVFGTVASPLGHEFMIGVPLYDRLDDGAGNWTTTATPTPASNNTTAISDGIATVWCADRTPIDLASFTSTTQDEIRVDVSFIDPFGRRISIQSTQPLPKGPFHEFWGGVGTNQWLHGRTGLGGKLVPQCFGYIITYSLAEIRIDGQLLPGNDKRLLHTMVTHGVRDASNDPGPAGGNGPFLGNDDEVDRDDLEFHVLCPPVRFLPNPQPNTPVVGFPQEFIHLLFEDVTLSGNTIRGVINR